MNCFAPWKRYKHITDIDLDDLFAQGVRLLLIDRDNTCVSRETLDVSPDILQWFRKAYDLGFNVCLVSNNIHHSEIEQSAKVLGCNKISGALKPSPHSLWRACKHYGVAKTKAVMIGDQVFTDVLAGRFAGIKTILVEPLSEVDLWYTKILRRVFEKSLER